MPNFYAGPDSGQALSSGLMAGYSFVDGIQERRRQALLDQQRARLAENHDMREQAQAGRAAEAFDMARQDHKDNKQRVLDTDLATAASSAAVAAGGFDKIDPNRRAALIKAARGARPDLSTLDDNAVWDATVQNAYTHDERGAVVEADARKLAANEEDFTGLLTDLSHGHSRNFAAAPGQPAAPRGPSLAQVGAATVAPPAAPAAPAEPIVTSSPQMVGRGVYKPVEAPAPVAKSFAPSNRAAAAAPIHEQAAADPLSYADAWSNSRDTVKDPQVRAATDTKVVSALQTDVASARDAYSNATDPREKATQGRRLMTRQSQLETMSKVTGNHVIDSSVPRGAAAGDKAANAVVTAASAMTQGGTPVQTEGSRRSDTTFMNRAAATKTDRWSPTQLKRIAHLVATKQISVEQGSNMARFGQLEKLEESKVTAMGGGWAAIVNGNGVSFVEMPTQKGAGRAHDSASATAHLAETKYAADEVFKGLRSAFGSKKDSDPEIGNHFTTMMQVLQREGPAIQRRTGIQLMDPETGAVDISSLANSPGNTAELVNAYKAYNDGNTGVWNHVFGNKSSLTDNTPDAAGARLSSAQAAGGSRLTQNPDGSFTYR